MSELVFKNSWISNLVKACGQSRWLDIKVVESLFDVNRTTVKVSNIISRDKPIYYCIVVVNAKHNLVMLIYKVCKSMAV